VKKSLQNHGYKIIFSTMHFALGLLREEKVAVVPGTAFG
jgi:aspartate/methionine/tyrosine aminotransferase